MINRIIHFEICSMMNYSLSHIIGFYRPSSEQVCQQRALETPNAAELILMSSFGTFEKGELGAVDGLLCPDTVTGYY